uniref:Uncharacterized protein n=1 Tax=Arundo donax TaxID=35708 RepID=A0A0A9AK91_ARUDO
MLRRHEAE